MSEWREVVFRELLEETVRTGIYKKKEFHGKGIKMVNMGELFTYPRLKNVPMELVELSSEEKERFLLRQGDLIFARRSLTAEGAGKCSFVHTMLEDTTFESSIIRARPDKRKASPEFLYYYFNSPYGKYLLRTILRQVAVAGITGTDLMELKIRVPEAEDQRAIGTVFSLLDDKIDLLQAQNQTLEDLAQTLFRQWMIEEVQDGREEKSLDEIANYLNGLACQKFPPENDVDKLPVLKIKDLRNGISEQSDWATINVPKEYLIESGDVIFSWSGSLMVKIWDGEKCVLNQHLFKVISEQYPKWFYYFWTLHHLEKFIAIAEGKATTMGHIKRSDLSNSIVIVPSKSDLKEMDQVLSPFIDKMILNNQQIAKLKTIRSTLLPKLMSGEVTMRLDNQ